MGLVLVVAGALSLKKNLGLRWWSRQFWVTEASRAATKRRARAEMSDLSDSRVDGTGRRVWNPSSWDNGLCQFRHRPSGSGFGSFPSARFLHLLVPYR